MCDCRWQLMLVANAVTAMIMVVDSKSAAMIMVTVGGNGSEGAVGSGQGEWLLRVGKFQVHVWWKHVCQLFLWDKEKIYWWWKSTSSSLLWQGPKVTKKQYIPVTWWYINHKLVQVHQEFKGIARFLTIILILIYPWWCQAFKFNDCHSCTQRRILYWTMLTGMLLHE